MTSRRERFSEWEPAAIRMSQWLGERVTTAEAVRKLGVCPDTLDNWCCGMTVPSVLLVRQLAKGFSHQPQFVLDVVNELLDGSDFRLVNIRDYDEAPTDVNGDGKTDGHDTTHAAVSSLGSVQRLLANHATRMDDDRLSPDEIRDDMRDVEEIERQVANLKAGLLKQAKR